MIPFPEGENWEIQEEDWAILEPQILVKMLHFYTSYISYELNTIFTLSCWVYFSYLNNKTTENMALLLSSFSLHLLIY